MSDTTEIVDTAECVEVVRALVKVFEDKGRPLTRELFKEFEPASYLAPSSIEVSTELVERAMKALGMPYPEVPKPRKIPSKPTDVQAHVLDVLNSSLDAVLREHVGLWMWETTYSVAVSEIGAGEYVAKKTFDCLRRYRWITQIQVGRWHAQNGLYKLTDAGREVLTRYQAKTGVVPAC